MLLLTVKLYCKHTCIRGDACSEILYNGNYDLWVLQTAPNASFIPVTPAPVHSEYPKWPRTQEVRPRPLIYLSIRSRFLQSAHTDFQLGVFFSANAQNKCPSVLNWLWLAPNTNLVMIRNKQGNLPQTGCQIQRKALCSSDLSVTEPFQCGNFDRLCEAGPSNPSVYLSFFFFSFFKWTGMKKSDRKCYTVSSVGQIVTWKSGLKLWQLTRKILYFRNYFKATQRKKTHCGLIVFTGNGGLQNFNFRLLWLSCYSVSNEDLVSWSLIPYLTLNVFFRVNVNTHN